MVFVGLIRLRSAPLPKLQGLEYVLNVTATDDNASGGPHSLSSTARVVVGVDDVNNNKPVFEEVRIFQKILAKQLADFVAFGFGQDCCFLLFSNQRGGDSIYLSVPSPQCTSAIPPFLPYLLIQLSSSFIFWPRRSHFPGLRLPSLCFPTSSD